MGVWGEHSSSEIRTMAFLEVPRRALFIPLSPSNWQSHLILPLAVILNSSARRKANYTGDSRKLSRAEAALREKSLRSQPPARNHAFHYSSAAAEKERKNETDWRTRAECKIGQVWGRVADVGLRATPGVRFWRRRSQTCPCRIPHDLPLLATHRIDPLWQGRPSAASMMPTDDNHNHIYCILPWVTSLHEPTWITQGLYFCVVSLCVCLPLLFYVYTSTFCLLFLSLCVSVFFSLLFYLHTSQLLSLLFYLCVFVFPTLHL